MEYLDYKFENNPRRKQEMKGRPIADKIYRQVFGEDVIISRFDNKYILDREFAIDVQLTLPSGLILLGQEKFLSFDQVRYRSVTVEYMQNPETEERGDWFKIGVQFYFTGYFTEDGEDFYPWIILRWETVVLLTHSLVIKWTDQKNKYSLARASFRYYPIDAFPESCIIACKK